MTHRNARLTPVTRAELTGEVERGWTQAEVARQFRVSRATVAKWVGRCRREGLSGLNDRTSRTRRSPNQTPGPVAERISELRRTEGWGPHQIGWELHIARSTVYAVLRRAGLHRLAWLHRTTREIVRYEHESPGDLVHLDVKKLGRIPFGGGKRFAPGFAETQSGPSKGRSIGTDFLHVAVDDHSRYAYVESLPNERGITAAGFLDRVVRHFHRQGARITRVLTDNCSCYRSRDFRDVAATYGIRLKRTRPYRPQTNGKAEAFIKTLQREWAYRRIYTSNQERLDTLQPFIHKYHHDRPHSSLGILPPASI